MELKWVWSEADVGLHQRKELKYRAQEIVGTGSSWCGD